MGLWVQPPKIRHKRCSQKCHISEVYLYFKTINRAENLIEPQVLYINGYAFAPVWTRSHQSYQCERVHTSGTSVNAYTPVRTRSHRVRVYTATWAPKKYSVGKLECWAVFAAPSNFIKHLRVASKFVIWTYHNSLPLVWLRKQKFSGWILELESINYSTEFVTV